MEIDKNSKNWAIFCFDNEDGYIMMRYKMTYEEAVRQKQIIANEMKTKNISQIEIVYRANGVDQDEGNYDIVDGVKITDLDVEVWKEALKEKFGELEIEKIKKIIARND